jgi:YfiH family protein
MSAPTNLDAPAHVLRARVLIDRGVPHAFTTRRGAGGRRWDLTHVRGADLEDLRVALGSKELGVDFVRQVHGTHIVELGSAPLPPETEADGLVSEVPGRSVLVRTADCVPILLAGADGRRVAAVHAGWRGLVAGVIPHALEVMRAKDIVAAVGPCLCSSHFEVGEEVADSFGAAGLEEAVVRRAGVRPHVDLVRAATLQLAHGGVREIESLGRCTWEDTDLDSHRRDVTHAGAAATGRLGACIAPRVDSRRAE